MSDHMTSNLACRPCLWLRAYSLPILSDHFCYSPSLYHMSLLLLFFFLSWHFIHAWVSLLLRCWLTEIGPQRTCGFNCRMLSPRILGIHNFLSIQGQKSELAWLRYLHDFVPLYPSTTLDTFSPVFLLIILFKQKFLLSSLSR